MKVLRSVPRRSLGGLFQASTSSRGMSPPPHTQMSPLNPWTWAWGGELFTEWMSPLANVG